MNPIKLAGCIIMALVVSMFVLSDPRPTWSAEGENHCFTCHTSARKLIKITREIAEANKGKPGGSAETEGEG